MKNKFVKLLVRTLLLFIAVSLICIALVVQPVFTNKDPKNPVAQPEQLKTYVYWLSDTLPNNVARANILDEKADYLYSQSQNFNTEVSYQPYDVMGVEYNNVVVKFKGKNNCGTYVIGAHFDTYNELPGADDNSSGTAGLLELVRLFSNNPPKCDLELVFYNLEEPPYFRSEHMGSYIHAKRLKDSKVDVKMMLSLETIGYFSDKEGSQDYPINGMQSLYSTKGDFISIVGNFSQIGITRELKKTMRSVTDLPVYSINAPSFIVGIDFSDHLNYWAFDYPAVMVTDSAFNRNKNYHTEYDTAEKLDYKRMAKVIDGVYYAINGSMDEETN